ncbi:hypothetical protein [Streptomyces sp. NPDC018711]|uniref:hypothetical protein n=1 Tax=Streptomyces sp. NPDC018711 TaxID=3365052 RepID=UPI0037ACB702
MTDTFAPLSRMARVRRLLTPFLLTAAFVAAVAVANNTDTDDGWWPRTGGAFTPPTGTQSTPAAPMPETIGRGSVACGVGLDRASCTYPAPDSGPGTQEMTVVLPVIPSVWRTALFLLPVAAGLTVVGRTRTRKALR